MRPSSAATWERLALLGARILFHLGWVGVVGAVALVLATGRALVLLEQSKTIRRALADTVPPANAVTSDPGPRPEAPVAPSSGPSRAEVATVLRRIEQAATAAGVGWPRAEYRISPGSELVTGSLEIQSTVQATYPQVRQFLRSVMVDMPTATFRDLSISRATAESTVVQAKVSIVVYLTGKE